MMGSNSKFGIFLHLSHALVSIFTLIGFHFTGEVWDEMNVPLSTTTGTKSSAVVSGRKSCPGQRHKSYWNPFEGGDSCGTGPDISFTGTLWILVVGLLGLCALGILIAVWTPQRQKNMLKWYYAGAAFFILFFATTSYNKVGGEFGKCTSSGNCPHYLLPIFLICLTSIGHTVIFGAGFLIALIDQAKPSSSPTSARTCPYICKKPGLPDATAN